MGIVSVEIFNVKCLKGKKNLLAVLRNSIFPLEKHSKQSKHSKDVLNFRSHNYSPLRKITVNLKVPQRLDEFYIK